MRTMVLSLAFLCWQGTTVNALFVPRNRPSFEEPAAADERFTVSLKRWNRSSLWSVARPIPWRSPESSGDTTARRAFRPIRLSSGAMAGADRRARAGGSAHDSRGTM